MIDGRLPWPRSLVPVEEPTFERIHAHAVRTCRPRTRRPTRASRTAAELHVEAAELLEKLASVYLRLSAQRYRAA